MNPSETERIEKFARLLADEHPEEGTYHDYRRRITDAYNAANVWDRFSFRLMIRLAFWIDRRLSPSKRKLG